MKGQKRSRAISVGDARALVRSVCSAFGVKRPRIVARLDTVLIEDGKRVLAFYQRSRRSRNGVIVLWKGSLDGKVTICHEVAHHISRRHGHTPRFKAAFRGVKNLVRGYRAHAPNGNLARAMQGKAKEVSHANSQDQGQSERADNHGR